MNDCFNDSYILIQQLIKIFIDLNKASVTFYNFLAFKKFRTTQMYHYSWICRDFCSTKMQSCHIIFVVERFLIRLSILCNFIVASVKLTKKLWHFTYLTFSMTAFKEQRFFLLVTLQQINSCTLIFISSTRPIVCWLNTEKSFW